MATVNEKMTAIADAIRSKTGKTEPLSLDGMADSVDAVFEAGKQAEHDAFWDEYQNYGNRKNYESAFAFSWGKNSFKPKYNMQPTYAASMFYRFNDAGNTGNDETVRLNELLEAQGVALDFSKATNINYCFQNARIAHIGVIDLSSINGTITNSFANMYWLQSIEKIVVHEGISYSTNCFNTQSGTASIIFEGAIGSTLKIGCGLTKESIESIVGALSATASSQTLTIKLNSVQKAFETSSGANDGNTSAEWLNLVASKPNWTITLA